MNKSLLDRARGEKPSGFVLKNARILDVFQEKIQKGDLALEGERIVGWGNYRGDIEVDLAGSYVVPALIDPHLHIESSQVSVSRFAREVTARGILTVVADPHEIANVAGRAGIEYFLARGRDMPWNFHLMLPSCVPAAFCEESGAVLNAEELASLMQEKNVLGLGEVMDYPAVIEGDEQIWQKIRLFEDRFIDGHAPEVGGEDLNAYLMAGIRADHECTTPEEAEEKASRGMHIMIREGSVTRDLENLLPVVNGGNAGRFMFATDDRQPEDIIDEGHLDHAVQKAISLGMKPARAFRLATHNPACALGLNDLGAIAPNFRADLLLLSSLENATPEAVIKDGKFLFGGENFKEEVPEMEADFTRSLEIEDGRLGDKIQQRVFNSVNCKPVDVNDFSLPAGKTYRLIELRDEQVITGASRINAGKYETSREMLREERAARLAAVERHRASGRIGLGLVRGFGLKHGALATTVSHDSHNIIVLGENAEDMAAAVDIIMDIQGGMVVVSEGEILAELALPIAGLMSECSMAETAEAAEDLRKAAERLGIRHSRPFMQLSFLSLPVIPRLKLTVKGLFDVEKFEHVPLVVK